MPARNDSQANDVSGGDAVFPVAGIAFSALEPHPRNYRLHPPQQIQRLRESLKRFGQVRPVVVQDSGGGSFRVVAGHGVVIAAKSLGYEKIQATVLPAVWAESEILAYLIADNETARSGEDDPVQLADLLLEQRTLQNNLESLGWNEEELSTLLQRVRPTDIPQFKSYDERVEDTLPTERCSVCGRLRMKQ